jgi:hypothetical protein
VSPSNQDVDLSSIPTGPTGCTARKLYRTTGTGSSYLLLATISDNVTTTYNDTVADGSLGGLVDETRTVPPRGLWCPVEHNDRLWALCRVTGSYGGVTLKQDRLYFSEVGLPEYWGTEGNPNFIDVTASEEDMPATGLVNEGGELWIHYPRGIYVLRGYSVNLGWQIERRWDGIGCQFPHTLVASDYGQVYGTRFGVYLYDGVVAENISEDLEDIVTWTDEIGVSLTPFATCLRGRYYYLFDGTYVVGPDAYKVFICDLKTRRWTVCQGFGVGAMYDPLSETVDASGQNYPYAGLLFNEDATGKVGEHWDPAVVGVWTGVTGKYRTQEMSFGLPEIAKRYTRILIDCAFRLSG